MIRFLSFILVVVALYVIYKGALLLLAHEVQQGIKRLAYAVSGFWLGLPLLLMLAKTGWSFAEVDREAWITWVLLAVLPNALFWVAIWVLRGFQRS
ncbi:MAG: hypothetical protein R3E95_24605 [Thiolinea sp.]